MKAKVLHLGADAGCLISPAIAEDTPQIKAEVTKATSASRQVPCPRSTSAVPDRWQRRPSFTVSTHPHEWGVPFKWNVVSFLLTI